MPPTAISPGKSMGKLMRMLRMLYSKDLNDKAFEMASIILNIAIIFVCATTYFFTWSSPSHPKD
jgi:hypothetical protein